MKKSKLFLLIFISLCLFFSSCSNDDSTVPEAKAKRTVLVYMIASNNLAPNAVKDCDEMRSAASYIPDGARWLVYCVTSSSEPVLMELTPRGWVTLKNFTSTTPSVSAQRMREVLTTVRTEAPAEKYGLVLWSHANGWIEDGINEPDITPQSFGSDNGRTMNITTLASVLADYPVEFIYADCCDLMNTETALQLYGTTSIFAGSPTELPAEGMPYEETLPMLCEGNIVGAAQAAMKRYATPSISNPKYPFGTLSVIDVNMMPQLADATRALYQAAKVPAGYKPSYLLTDKTNCTLFDLKHFVKALDADNTLLEKWNTVFDKTVLYSEAHQYLEGTSVQLVECNGIGTYLLRTGTSPDDKGYSLYKWYDKVARYQPLF